jgi:hypothetical protein
LDDAASRINRRDAEVDLDTRAAADPSYGKGLPGSDTGILATDRDSPLGDTSEHSEAPR